MAIEKWLKIALRIWKLKSLEFFRFNPLGNVGLLFIYIAVFIGKFLNRDLNFLLVAGKIFRHVNFEKARRHATHVLEYCIKKYGDRGVSDRLFELCRVSKYEASRLKESILEAKRPFDGRLIILSPPVQGKRGVLLLKFTENFKYFRAVFDLETLLKHYVPILEPSFCGYFDEDILCLLGYDCPLVVESPEKVDTEFIRGLNANLIPVEMAANWWVDHRTFFPIAGIEKVYDIIMVALWSDFKRHYHLFQALSKAKNISSLKVALVGVPWPRSLTDIKDIAKFYKVNGSIDYFEDITQKELNILYNKSKIFLLLSRKEGCNKAIIEAMHAGIPGFLLEGYNFGQRYSYINKKTGGFIVMSGLSKFIDNIDETLRGGEFAPRDWVLENMSIDVSVRKLKNKLTEIEERMQIGINADIVAKVNSPDLEYFDSIYWKKYASFYDQLATFLR